MYVGIMNVLALAQVCSFGLALGCLSVVPAIVLLERRHDQFDRLGLGLDLCHDCSALLVLSMRFVTLCSPELQDQARHSLGPSLHPRLARPSCFYRLPFHHHEYS